METQYLYKAVPFSHLIILANTDKLLNNMCNTFSSFPYKYIGRGNTESYAVYFAD